MIADMNSLDLAVIGPAAAIDIMIQWYETVRAVDAAPSDEDGDGLLFQWGTDEQPPTFRYTLTRQLISRQDGEQDIWQLSLTLHYEASTESRNLPGDRAIWCFTTAAIPAWRAAIRASAASTFVADRLPIRATLSFEPAC